MCFQFGFHVSVLGRKHERDRKQCEHLKGIEFLGLCSSMFVAEAEDEQIPYVHTLSNVAKLADSHHRLLASFSSGQHVIGHLWRCTGWNQLQKRKRWPCMVSSSNFALFQCLRLCIYHAC